MKVLYIATTAKNRNRLDGETTKCRLLESYLTKQNTIKLFCVDTDNWKKHKIKLIFLILFYYIKCDKIVISAADRGANIVLNFFEKIRCRKEIFYFVIGGSLYKNIKEKKWKVETYNKIKMIYVEAEKLKKDLKKLSIKNIEVKSNFREATLFKNNYQKTEATKFVFFGRVIKEKGVEVAISLMKKLNSDKFNVILDIYGQITPEYLKEIESNFDNNIQYKGEIQPNGRKEYEILSYYDVFILPTEYPGECLPGALIDAYIAGLAVIVSDWPYAKEYVIENKNGKIFAYKNYDDLFSKAREMIVNNEILDFKRESKKLSEKYQINYLLSDFREQLLGKSNNEIF